MLIEPVQIYTLGAALLTIYLLAAQREQEHLLAGYCGLIIAASILFKSAAMAFLPGLGIYILAKAREGRDHATYVQRAVQLAALMLGPALVVMAAWKIVGPSKIGQAPSVLDTFTGELLDKALSNDWRELAERYIGAVGSYVIGYKFPITIFAILGVFLAALRKQYAVILVWGAFSLNYLFSLYWYHLAAFGEYYYHNLNSIPRFTRVPLQTLHIAGYVVITHQLLDLLMRDVGQTLVQWSRTTPATLVASAVVALLLGLQGLQIYRSVEDVTTRVHQTIDPRIMETKNAVDILVPQIQSGDDGNGSLVIIDQGGDSEPLNYARYFGHGRVKGHPSRTGLDVIGVSWTDAAPVNVWQKQTTATKLRRQFADATVIWSINMDAWILSILKDMVQPASCLRKTTNKYFVRAQNPPLAHLFTCLPKPGTGP